MTTQVANDIVMWVECDEPEGIVERAVRPCRLSFEKLKYLYEKLSEFDVLFNDHVKNDPSAFISSFIVDVNGRAESTGLIWEVDDVGILYITDIRPGYEAMAHFSFWDKRLRGREKLAQEMIKYVMKRFKFHRIVCEVPMYATPSMGFVERVGFQHEGRKRQVVRYHGEWFDVNQYSIVEGDLDEL